MNKFKYETRGIITLLVMGVLVVGITIAAYSSTQDVRHNKTAHIVAHEDIISLHNLLLLDSLLYEPDTVLFMGELVDRCRIIRQHRDRAVDSGASGEFLETFDSLVSLCRDVGRVASQPNPVPDIKKLLKERVPALQRKSSELLDLAYGPVAEIKVFVMDDAKAMSTWK